MEPMPHCHVQVQKLGRKLHLQINWGSRRDHLDPSLRAYKARPASILWPACSAMLGPSKAAGTTLSAMQHRLVTISAFCLQSPSSSPRAHMTRSQALAHNKCSHPGHRQTAPMLLASCPVDWRWIT